MKGFALALVLLFTARGAEASFSSVFGIGPESIGMGGTSVREGEVDAFSAYNQPARLGNLREAKLSLGILNTEVKLRPFGRVVVNEAGTIGNFDSAGVLGGRGQILGLAIPLGNKKRPLGLGATAYFSGDSVSRVSGPPINNPYYPVYQDVTRNATYTIGAAYRVWRGLSVGLGANTSLLSLADYRVVNAANGTSYSASTVEVKSIFSPTFAIAYDFSCDDECGDENADGGSPLVIGFLRRGKSELKTKLTAALSVQGLPVTGELVSYPHFSPAEWVLTGATRIDKNWLLALDLSYVEWSAYRNPYGSGNINSFIFGASKSDAEFKNVFVPKLGLAKDWRSPTAWLESLVARAGYAYHPSPVPNQTGNSNYADSTRHVFSTGIGMGVRNPLAETSSPLKFDLFVQYNLLTKRNVSKLAATNLGAPGYVVGGNIWVYGLGVSLDF